MAATKIQQLAWVWGLSLLLSWLLSAAGARWPEPLTPRADWALLLVFGPPLLMAVWLLARRPRRGGESLRKRESAAAEQETH